MTFCFVSRRMSPTEFANYIKQRAAMQQQMGGTTGGQQRPVSPVQHMHRGQQNGDAASNYFYQQQQYNGYQRQRQSNNGAVGYHGRNSGGGGSGLNMADYMPTQLQFANNGNSNNGWQNYGGDFGPQHFGGSPMGPLSPANYGAAAVAAQAQQQSVGPAQQQKMDNSYNAMGLGSSSYRSSPYQHLLVAN